MENCAIRDCPDGGTCRNEGMIEELMECKVPTLPVDILLFCPHCGEQHVDQSQPEKDWTNPPHKSHECQFCGLVWRPADVPTNGVLKITTEGQRDRNARPRYFLKEERLACIADACHLCRDNVPVEYHARISTWRHSTQFGQVPCAAGRIRERMEKER